MTILYFIIALGILVFVHEFGHFLMAKKQGIGVEKFSIGFGPKLFSFKKGETTYMASLLPLGGYVKLHGEDPPSEPSEKDETAKDDPKSYSARPVFQRVLVVFAGPFMNLLLAAVVMPVVFMIGRMEPVYLDQRPVVIGVKKDSPASRAGIKPGDEVIALGDLEPKTWKEALDFILLHGDEEAEVRFRRGKEVLSRRVVLGKSPETHAGVLGIEPMYFVGNEAVVDEVSPGGPAASGGLEAGDEVLKINQAPIATWTEMSEEVGASQGKRLAVTVRRGKDVLTVFIIPRYDEDMKKWLMGVKKDAGKRGEAFVKKRYSIGEAIVRGTEENLKLSGLTFSVLGRLVTFKLSYKTLGGPIRIAQASAMAAKSGLPDFLYFLVFLSLQLGLLNLLPFPVLDGGHLLFFGIEAASRRPLSAKVRGYAEQAGFVLLLTLMLFVTLNDVDSVWGFREILEKIKNIF